MVIKICDKGLDGNMREYLYGGCTALRIMNGIMSFHYLDEEGEKHSEFGYIPDEVTVLEYNENINEEFMKSLNTIKVCNLVSSIKGLSDEEIQKILKGENQ